MSSDAEEPVLIVCPACGKDQEDLDGFGMTLCQSCGYCTHLSVNGDICGICGKKVDVMEDKVALRLKMQAAQETLLQGWEAWEREHIDECSSERERLLRRKAFYSGAMAAYMLTLMAVVPDNEEEAAARLEALGDEVGAAITELDL